MALQSPSSSSSSFSYGFNYDVFLSFRGTDTRYGFTGNLCNALGRKGIRTFIDDRELQRGDEITPSLFKAIEDSRIAIIVFSVCYASSSFCLDELVHIIHYFKAKGRLVLPVFYDVDPSHIRHQTGSYGEGLAVLEGRLKNNKENNKDNMERLQKWKKALNQAASLSGHHFKLGNEYESEFIEEIVKEVSNKINRAPLHVANYHAGLESRLLDVKCHLDVGYDDRVCMLGIHGTGGIGKTTLARAIYNLIADQEFRRRVLGVDKAVALESQTIKHMIEDNGTDSGIPLPNVSSKILAKVIEYCKKHVEATASDEKPTEDELKAWDAEFVKVDQATLFDLILAANYLNIKSLLDLTCQTVANMIKGKTPEEIRKTFSITNNFTREEKEEVRRENLWAFE